MRSLARLGMLALLLAGGCAQSDSEPELSSVSSALAGTEVLSFDDAARWRGPGTLENSSVRSEGSASLSVRPRGWAVYESDAFAFSGRARELFVDVQLPANTAPLG